MTTSIVSQTKAKHTVFHQSAAAYAKVLKWPVFPLHTVHNGRCTCGRDCGSAGKHPRTKNGLKAATLDLQTINTWWTQWPSSNIGIPTGQASGFIAVDIDPRHGGHDSMDELVRQYGELPETVEALTGGGGRHILFKNPGGHIGNKAGIKPGIDIRGDGGYIVVSPSIHKSGGRYEWELSSRPENVPLADIPDWLLRLITEPEQDKPKKPVRYWMEILQGVEEGRRNVSAASLAGYLLRHGIAAPVAFEIMLLWNERNNPPDSREVIERTFNSILQAELKRLKGGRNHDT